ncbi:hypothetical protein BKA67DRAFT_359560 [Truncatella angustata]|uniref:Uncharacterized protein n=1 Tax=Truncatella angustata TaxID=152316 RepID=A0A9P8ZUV6_9PEZI|nr:uncharacterized protein BKA67DRAFT_359560 [Truncatella angustata]KAH6648294.1 hypothetical protein BKA67DRAFT_359560 [Truncatella angustata]
MEHLKYLLLCTLLMGHSYTLKLNARKLVSHLELVYGYKGHLVSTAALVLCKMQCESRPRERKYCWAITSHVARTCMRACALNGTYMDTLPRHLRPGPVAASAVARTQDTRGG